MWVCKESGGFSKKETENKKKNLKEVVKKIESLMYDVLSSEVLKAKK